MRYAHDKWEPGQQQPPGSDWESRWGGGIDECDPFLARFSSCLRTSMVFSRRDRQLHRLQFEWRTRREVSDCSVWDDRAARLGISTINGQVKGIFRGVKSRGVGVACRVRHWRRPCWRDHWLGRRGRSSIQCRFFGSMPHRYNRGVRVCVCVCVCVCCFWAVSLHCTFCCGDKWGVLSDVLVELKSIAPNSSCPNIYTPIHTCSHVHPPIHQCSPRPGIWTWFCCWNHRLFAPWPSVASQCCACAQVLPPTAALTGGVRKTHLKHG